MPKIEFLRERILRDENEGTSNQTVYRKGQRITVSDESARHWTDRGIAVLVEDEKPEPKKRGRPAKAVENEESEESDEG